MKNITASDRSALIRLASTLPAGSEDRKVILSSLKAASDYWDSPTFAEAVGILQPHVKGMVDYLNKESKYTWKASGGASPSSSLDFGEGASVTISAEAPRGEGGGWWTFNVGVSGQKDQVVVNLSAPMWQASRGRKQRQGYGQKYTTLANPAKLFPTVPGQPYRR